MQKIGNVLGEFKILLTNDKEILNYENTVGAAPEPAKCEFCGKNLYHEAVIARSRLIRYSDNPQECDCEATIRRKEAMLRAEKERQEEIELQKRMQRIASIQDKSLIGDKYKNVSFETTKTSHNKDFALALKRCKTYCDKADEVVDKGMGIYLWGASGVGKTHITACMANDLIKNHRKEVLFTNFYQISKAIRDTYNGGGTETENSIINKIADVEVLFLDDLGTESLSKNDGNNFMQDKIFEIINARYNNNKSTIFTSNYSIGELTAQRGFMEKTIDRILEMSTAIIYISGNSYRHNKRNEVIF